MLLAVLMHTTLIAFVPVSQARAAAVAWEHAIGVAAPFRLPVLFVLSGLLASRRVRQGSVRRRLWVVGWMYVLWSVVYVVLQTLGLDVWAAPFSMLPEAVGQLAAPRTVLWFLLRFCSGPLP